jgi:hypothetical protein
MQRFTEQSKRAEAALSRAAAARERADAARERIEAAHGHADGMLEGIEARRATDAVGRDRAADRREAEAEADQRELTDEMRRSEQDLRGAIRPEASLNRLYANVAERTVYLRFVASELAERVADQAEEHASYLETAARRGDRERRLAIANVEREIARIERQNAVRLRDLSSPFVLVEHLPRLLGAHPAAKSSHLAQ